MILKHTSKLLLKITKKQECGRENRILYLFWFAYILCKVKSWINILIMYKLRRSNSFYLWKVCSICDEDCIIIRHLYWLLAAWNVVRLMRMFKYLPVQKNMIFYLNSFNRAQFSKHWCIIIIFSVISVLVLQVGVRFVCTWNMTQTLSSTWNEAIQTQKTYLPNTLYYSHK